MARAARKKATRQYTPRKGRGRSKAESPEMRSGLGINMANYSSFPKAIRDRFIGGYEEAKSGYASGVFNVSGKLTKGKRKAARQAVFDHVRETGSERMQLYLNEPNDPGKAFRAGVRSGVQVIWNEESAGRSEYGARYNPSAQFYDQARSYGYSRAAVDRVRRAKGGADAPSSMASLKRDHDGNAYWPVLTARGTHWHYTIKKGAKGYYVAFRRRDGDSAIHYITPEASASRKLHYYRRKRDAFEALASHVFQGKHAAFKNPRRRR